MALQGLILFKQSLCERNGDIGVVVETEFLQKTSDHCHHEPSCICCKKRNIPTSQKSLKVLVLLSLIWLGTEAFIGSKPSNCTILLRTSSLGKQILWRSKIHQNFQLAHPYQSPFSFLLRWSIWAIAFCYENQVEDILANWIKDLHIFLKHSFSPYLFLYSSPVLSYKSTSFLSWWYFSSKLPQ